MKKTLAPLSVLRVLAVFPLVVHDNYYRHLMILFLMWVVIGSAWNLIAGYTGQVSFGDAAFFGSGAYAAGLLSTHLHISAWWALAPRGFRPLSARVRHPVDRPRQARVLLRLHPGGPGRRGKPRDQHPLLQDALAGHRGVLDGGGGLPLHELHGLHRPRRGVFPPRHLHHGDSRGDRRRGGGDLRADGGGIRHGG